MVDDTHVSSHTFDVLGIPQRISIIVAVGEQYGIRRAGVQIVLGKINTQITLTAVVVDGDLKRAVAYYDHSLGEEAEGEIQEAFTELRGRLQGAVGRQAKLKRTPELRFEADAVLRHAERIEQVIRGLHADDDTSAEPAAE